MASTGEVSVLWSHMLYVHSPAAFLDLSQLPFLTVFPVQFFGFFGWLSHGCWSVLVLQTSLWLCSQTGAAVQHLSLIATREPIHFALILLLAWVIYSIVPSSFLLHCVILDMTLNIRIICNLLSPRGHLRRWGHTSHQLCPTEVKMPGDLTSLVIFLCTSAAHNNW